MPIIKSAIKRARQTLKRRSHNLQVKRAIHDDVRALHSAIGAGEAEAIVTAFKAAQSEIDRAVKKGTLHRNTAARRKSQLSASVLSATSATPEITPKVTKGTGGGAKKATAKTSAAKSTKSTTTQAATSKTATKKPAAKKPAAK